MTLEVKHPADDAVVPVQLLLLRLPADGADGVCSHADGAAECGDGPPALIPPAAFE